MELYESIGVSHGFRFHHSYISCLFWCWETDMTRKAILFSHILKSFSFYSLLAFSCWILFACRENMQNTFTSKEDLVVKQRIRIDRSPKKNESALSSLMQPLMPNVPLQLWEENKQKKWFSKRLRGRCATKKARPCQK